MRIITDFDWVAEPQQTDVNINGYSYLRTDIDDALRGIREAAEWTQKSAFAPCFRNISVYITDCPGAPREYAGIDENTNQVYVHLNLLGIIWDYHESPYYRELMFQQPSASISLLWYSRFLTLHEFGHIVHAALAVPSEKTLVRKFEALLLKARRDYEQFDRHLTDCQATRETERNYRKLPLEKTADRFALLNLSFESNSNNRKLRR